MLTLKRLAFAVCLVCAAVSLAPAQERLCDTSFEDCRQPLWDLIDRETVGIDVSFWFIQDTSLSNKLIARALPRLGQQGWIGAVSGGEIRYDPFRFLAHGLELGCIVEPGVEKALELAFRGAQFA